MKTHTPEEILANTALWDEDLSDLAEALKQC